MPQKQHGFSVYSGGYRNNNTSMDNAHNISVFSSVFAGGEYHINPIIENYSDLDYECYSLWPGLYSNLPYIKETKLFV